MSKSGSVAEVIKEHVVHEVEGIDRMFCTNRITIEASFGDD